VSGLYELRCLPSCRLGHIPRSPGAAGTRYGRWPGGGRRRRSRTTHTEHGQPLAAHQPVFSMRAPDGPGSGEMPSASRPFTAPLVTSLVSRGVQITPVRLHTGMASAEEHEPPNPERFAVPESTAWLVNAARAGGGQVVAVGTTVVRALESAVDGRGVLRAARGWTELLITPERGVRAGDGLPTGLHEPAASHLLVLEAVSGPALLERVNAEAVDRGLSLARVRG
jgi:S-adenosylmethionine:tRNA ribosyltransferase-isomerase